MDIPDRIIDDSTKLWRFRAQIIYAYDIARAGVARGYRVMNPVPVYADSKLVGFGLVAAGWGTVYADVVVDPAIPQRLDVEVGTKLWYLLPKVTVYYPGEAPLILRADPAYPPPIPVMHQWESWEFDYRTCETVEIQALEFRDGTTDPNLTPIGHHFL